MTTKRVTFLLGGALTVELEPRDDEDDDDLIDRAIMSVPTSAWAEAVDIEETDVGDVDDVMRVGNLVHAS